MRRRVLRALRETAVGLVFLLAAWVAFRLLLAHH